VVAHRALPLFLGSRTRRDSDFSGTQIPYISCLRSSWVVRNCWLPPRWLVFEYGSGHVGSVVDKAVLGPVLYEYFGIAYHSFHLLLHPHLHLSSRTGTGGQMVAVVPSGLSHPITRLTNSVPFERPQVMQPLGSFPALYGTPKVHYRIHKSSPLFATLSHTKVHCSHESFNSALLCVVCGPCSQFCYKMTAAFSVRCVQNKYFLCIIGLTCLMSLIFVRLVISVMSLLTSHGGLHNTTWKRNYLINAHICNCDCRKRRMRMRMEN
jgi:hypothetical protein